MVNQKVLQDLLSAFPNAIINNSLEFVADPNPRVNTYFRLEDCESREDITAKVLEWLSRDAFKSIPFSAEWRNKQVHKYHLDGINQFCGTNFSEGDIETIYTLLGNRIRHQRTLDFIRSGFNISVLVRSQVESEECK